MTRPEVEHPPVSRGVHIVEIPCSGEAGTRVEPPATPPSQELVMIRFSHVIAMAGSSSGSGAPRELVWPYPGDPWKVQFILWDEQEVQLWDILGEEDSPWSPISPKPG